MEFPFSVKQALGEGLTLIDGSATSPQVATIIDEMGKASARAQGLPSAITSAARTSSNRHRLYVMTGGEGRGCVIGFLKVGKKRLFLLDQQGRHNELEPLCVLDFYVHESLQRNGHGREIFNDMLRREGVLPHHLAIDRPSPKLLAFLRKHYGIANTLPQVNNFVVFEGFFRNRSGPRAGAPAGSPGARGHAGGANHAQPSPGIEPAEPTVGLLSVSAGSSDKPWALTVAPNRRLSRSNSLGPLLPQQQQQHHHQQQQQQGLSEGVNGGSRRSGEQRAAPLGSRSVWNFADLKTAVAVAAVGDGIGGHEQSSVPSAAATTSSTVLSLPPIVSSPPIGRPQPRSPAAAAPPQGGGTGFPARTPAPQSAFPARVAAVRSALPACAGIGATRCAPAAVGSPARAATLRPGLPARGGATAPGDEPLPPGIIAGTGSDRGQREAAASSPSKGSGSRRQQEVTSSPSKVSGARRRRHDVTASPLLGGGVRRQRGATSPPPPGLPRERSDSCTVTGGAAGGRGGAGEWVRLKNAYRDTRPW